MSNYNRFDRRTTIKGIGSLLAGGLVSSASAAAADDVADFNSEFTVENGKVVLLGKNITPVQRFEDIDPRQAFDAEFVAGFLNYGVENGDFRVFEQDGQIMADPTVTLEEDGDSIEDLCGENDLTWDLNLTNGQVKIWMDHDLTDEVALDLAGGAALSTVAAAVATATGAGAAPAAVLTIVAAALGYYATALTLEDDGCGVKITFTKYYDPITPPIPSIEPQ